MIQRLEVVDDGVKARYLRERVTACRYRRVMPILYPNAPSQRMFFLGSCEADLASHPPKRRKRLYHRRRYVDHIWLSRQMCLGNERHSARFLVTEHANAPKPLEGPLGRNTYPRSTCGTIPSCYRYLMCLNSVDSHVYISHVYFRFESPPAAGYFGCRDTKPYRATSSSQSFFFNHSCCDLHVFFFVRFLAFLVLSATKSRVGGDLPSASCWSCVRRRATRERRPRRW